MEKFGIEKSEVIEYCRRKVSSGEMSVQDALAKCRRHGIEIDKDELIKG